MDMNRIAEAHGSQARLTLVEADGLLQLALHSELQPDLVEPACVEQQPRGGGVAWLPAAAHDADRADDEQDDGDGDHGQRRRVGLRPRATGSSLQASLANATRPYSDATVQTSLLKCYCADQTAVTAPSSIRSIYAVHHKTGGNTGVATRG
eukprot:430113-Pleurochrysis_carterae.AAC.2